MNAHTTVRVATIALAATWIAACAHKTLKKTAQANTPEPVAQAAAVSPVETSQAEPNLAADAMRSIPELKTVYFDYDSDHLRPETRDVLASNAEWLKGHDGVRVQIAGNCDQRGTVEYNLALGQRRAVSVREYYMDMGVSGDRLGTISYGKEHLVCRESTEACWQKNRRAETLEAVSRNISRR